MTPTRAARICSHPGCFVIVQGVPRCAGHTVTRSQRQAKDPAQAKFYSSARWTKISLLVRRQEPFCRICKVKRSTNVDHIDGDYQNNARENLRALCSTCEGSRTAKQHRAKVGQ